MSQLETNTISLQTLLDKVNALPDAGSGGSSGAKVVTGTFNVASQITTANKTIATITGIGFTPNAIAIIHVGDSSRRLVEASKYYFVANVMIGDNKSVAYVTRTSNNPYIYVSTSQATTKITTNEDGFVFSTGSTATIVGSGDYMYIAAQI